MVNKVSGYKKNYAFSCNKKPRIVVQRTEETYIAVNRQELKVTIFWETAP
jgi:hypothetical protein